MFQNKEQLKRIDLNINGLLKLYTSLQSELDSETKRVSKLEEKIDALQELLKIEYIPKIEKIIMTKSSEFNINTEKKIEPAKFVFINRFKEKVKKSKEVRSKKKGK